MNEYENWMTKDYCDDHKDDFFSAMFGGTSWEPDQCCAKAAKYSSRTAGLFHVEF